MNAEYFHLVLEASSAMLAAAPGQFFHLRCPSRGGDSPLLRRPMSVYRVNQPDRSVEFLYKVTGSGTRGLATLVPGDRLDTFGPMGRGFQLPANTKHVWMIARGVGMATLAPLAELAVRGGAKVTALLSARSADLVMSEDYLRSVGADTLAVTDGDGTSEVAHIERLLRQSHAALAVDLLATCGSNRLLQLLKRVAADLKVPGQVSLEQQMGCAIGMCFCCVRPFRSGETVTYRRICCEGPVFELSEAISW